MVSLTLVRYLRKVNLLDKPANNATRNQPIEPPPELELVGGVVGVVGVVGVPGFDVAGADTEISSVSVELAPSVSVTVNSTVYVHSLAYEWLGSDSVLVLPSPKSHA